MIWVQENSKTVLTISSDTGNLMAHDGHLHFRELPGNPYLNPKPFTSPGDSFFRQLLVTLVNSMVIRTGLVSDERG